jgi:predicted GNAT family acetyltransferase
MSAKNNLGALPLTGFLPALKVSVLTPAAPAVSQEKGARDAVRINLLTPGDETEVTSFLSARPLHTVTMASFIRDNGLMNPLNRGRFYACRDSSGRLEGVALVGHTVLFESRSDAATEAFAHLARECRQLHLMMAEHERAKSFWGFYAPRGEEPRLLRHVYLLEQRSAQEGYEPVPDLRPATLDDLETVMIIQAEMIHEESGVNPMETDLLGFRIRCLRRIEQGRVWVLMKEDGRPVFKADVIAETPETVYIEGVYVSPQERRKGYGQRCLAHMSGQLLKRSRSLTLFVERENTDAQSFYGNSGFEFNSHYNILYF